MEFLLKEIERALEADLYFIALQAALTLPDICASLESAVEPKKRKLGAEYAKWYEDHVQTLHPTWLSGEDCWQYRCSCLHSGSSIGENYSRVIFLAPGQSQIRMHNNIIGDAINIDLKTFCLDMIDAVRVWEASAKETDIFKKNYPRLMRVYPEGFPPYIVGTPVIT